VAATTLGEALGLLQQELGPAGKVIIKVQLDGADLAGAELVAARAQTIAGRAIVFSTTSQAELAQRMIGRLAALVEYLGTQHPQIAKLLEQGQSSKALEQFGSVLSAWQQIQQSYGSLLTLLHTRLEDLRVREIPAEQVLADFQRQLQDISQAVQANDLVLLADILQYEMDSAVANWTGLLEAALGVVENQGNGI